MQLGSCRYSRNSQFSLRSANTDHGEKAGSTQDVRLAYPVDSKTYVYSTVRVLGTLCLVEDWNKVWSSFVTGARMTRL
jgi:hypothetical protein